MMEAGEEDMRRWWLIWGEVASGNPTLHEWTWTTPDFLHLATELFCTCLTGVNARYDVRLMERRQGHDSP